MKYFETDYTPKLTLCQSSSKEIQITKSTNAYYALCKVNRNREINRVLKLAITKNKALTQIPDLNSLTSLTVRTQIYYLKIVNHDGTYNSIILTTD